MAARNADGREEEVVVERRWRGTRRKGRKARDSSRVRPCTWKEVQGGRKHGCMHRANMHKGQPRERERESSFLGTMNIVVDNVTIFGMLYAGTKQLLLFTRSFSQRPSLQTCQSVRYQSASARTLRLIAVTPEPRLSLPLIKPHPRYRSSTDC